MNHTNHHPATRRPHHKLRRPARLLAVSLLATAITATAGCGSPEPDAEPLSRTAQGSDRHLEAQADEIAGSVAARVARASGSDRHLETLAEAAGVAARVARAGGSDRHLETLAEAAGVAARVARASGSDRHLETLAEASAAASNR